VRLGLGDIISVLQQSRLQEMCGDVSEDRYFADIRNSHGYRQDTDTDTILWICITP